MLRGKTTQTIQRLTDGIAGLSKAITSLEPIAQQNKLGAMAMLVTDLKGYRHYLQALKDALPRPRPPGGPHPSVSPVSPPGGEAMHESLDKT